MVVSVVVVVKRDVAQRKASVPQSFFVVVLRSDYGLGPIAVGKTDVEKRRMFCAENPGIDNEHEHEVCQKGVVKDSVPLTRFSAAPTGQGAINEISQGKPWAIDLKALQAADGLN